MMLLLLYYSTAVNGQYEQHSSVLRSSTDMVQCCTSGSSRGPAVDISSGQRVGRGRPRIRHFCAALRFRKSSSTANKRREPVDRDRLKTVNAAACRSAASPGMMGHQ